MDLIEDIKKLMAAKSKFYEDVLREKKSSEHSSEHSSNVDRMLQEQLSINYQASLDFPIDNQILEQFRMGASISFDDKMQIVGALNEMMSGRNVRVHRDQGNDSWVCLHYRPKISEHQKEPKIAVLIPNSDFVWGKFHEFKEDNDKTINEWLPPATSVKNPADLFVMETCRQSSDKSDQFLLALVYAIGSCLEFRRCYLEPFGEDDWCKEIVLRVIQQALLERRLPTIEVMWGPQL